jgi:hypothetical protein
MVEQEHPLGVEQPQVELLGQELDLLVVREAHSKIHVLIALFMEAVAALVVMQVLVVKVLLGVVLFLVLLEQVVRVVALLLLVVLARLKVRAEAVAVRMMLH